MNNVQKAYALAKAQFETINEAYYTTLSGNAERQALLTEEEHLILSGTEEANTRCLEIEDIIIGQEIELDTKLGRTEAKNVLKAAEEAMIGWAFNRLKKYPEAFRMTGVSFSDIESLRNVTGKAREKVIDLAFRYAG